MKLAFKTRDGLIALADVSECDENSPACMRALKPYPPLVNGMREEFMDYRKYERTYELYKGFVVFQEV